MAKKKDHDRRKAQKQTMEESRTVSPGTPKIGHEVKKEESDVDETMEGSDDEEIKKEPNSVTPITPLDQVVNGEGLKRKREMEVNEDGIKMEEDEATPSKRARSITPPEPPPPPPPPPAEDQMLLDGKQSLDDWPTFEDSITNGGEGDGTEYTHPPPPPPPPSKDFLGTLSENDAAFAQNDGITTSIETDDMMGNNREEDNVSTPGKNGFGGMNGSRSMSYMEARSD